MTKTFIEVFSGADAGDAFLSSTYADMASYPPSGIGQKHGFIQLRPAEGEQPFDAAQRYIACDASPISGVSAPAGCIKISDQEYLFFGWVRETPGSSAHCEAHDFERCEAA